MKNDILLHKTFIAAFCCLMFSVASAQRKQVDSLLNLLNVEKADSNKAKIYRQLGSYYTDNNNDKAISYYENSQAIAKQLNRQLDVANDYYSIGYCYRTKGDFVQALSNYIQSASLYEKLNENRRLSNAFMSIAVVYDNTNNISKQIEYLDKAQQLIEHSGDSVQLNYLFGQKGQSYDHREKYDSALLYYNKAYEIAVVLNNNMDVVSVLSNIGLTYKHQQKTDQAIQYFNHALQLLDTAITPPDVMAVVYNNIAATQSQAGNYAAAETAFSKSIYWSDKAAATLVVLENYRNMTDMYGQKKDYKQQVFYLQKYHDLKDSLYTSDTKNQLTELEADYQIQQKNAQINKQQQEVDKQKNERNVFLIIAVATAVLLIAAVVFYRRIQKKNALLMAKNEEINQQKEALQNTLTELQKAQTQLIQSEKMASLGELTAGIAHEIQNPLNFVNNFSETSRELIEEMEEALKSNDQEEVLAITADVKNNLQKIAYHGARADSIVKGMLQHSRSSAATKELTDINKLADEYLRLSYHGLRAKDKNFNAELKTEFDNSIDKVNAIPQDIGRVLLNLFNNAFYAVNEQKKLTPENYKPTVCVSTRSVDHKVEIVVKDNGIGIPQKVIDKIYQPFFTTKPSGQGTGLGLSLSYDIIKAHGGEMKVESEEGEGTSFILYIPYS